MSELLTSLARTIAGTLGAVLMGIASCVLAAGLLAMFLKGDWK